MSFEATAWAVRQRDMPAAAWAGRQVLGLSLLQLGRTLNRDHTSIIHLLRKAGDGRWAVACAETEAALRQQMAGGGA